MDPTETKPTDNQLPLEGRTPTSAGDQAQPPSPAAAEKAAEPAAKTAGKPRRPRRGPPPEGVEEARIDMILTTSKLSGEGGRLRRGVAVSVPERRAGQMLHAGKVRKATAAEIATAVRRFGPVVRIR